MNKDRAKEELRDRKILAEIEYNQSEDAKKKDNLLRYIQALDIAIECLETRYQMNDKGEITPIDNEWVDVRDGLPKAKGYFNLSDTVLCKDSGSGYHLGFYDYFENKFISSEDSVSWLIDIVEWKYIKPRKEQV